MLNCHDNYHKGTTYIIVAITTTCTGKVCKLDSNLWQVRY